jgi:hypothetical protein
MMETGQKKAAFPKWVELSAMLYEFHGTAREEEEQDTSPCPVKAITIIAADLETALRYMNLHMPYFRVRAVLQLGSALIVLEQS